MTSGLYLTSAFPDIKATNTERTPGTIGSPMRLGMATGLPLLSARFNQEKQPPPNPLEHELSKLAGHEHHLGSREQLLMPPNTPGNSVSPSKYQCPFKKVFQVILTYIQVSELLFQNTGSQTLMAM